MRDRRGSICFHHLPDQPIGWLALSGVSQELENVYQAWARKHSLIANVTVASAEILKKLDLNVIRGSEVAMATLGSEDMMAQAVPVETPFAQPSSSGNDRQVAG